MTNHPNLYYPYSHRKLHATPPPPINLPKQAPLPQHLSLEHDESFTAEPVALEHA